MVVKKKRKAKGSGVRSGGAVRKRRGGAVKASTILSGVGGVGTAVGVPEIGIPLQVAGAIASLFGGKLKKKGRRKAGSVPIGGGVRKRRKRKK